MKESDHSRDLLNQRLKHYYRQQTLPQDKLQELKGFVQTTKKERISIPLQIPQQRDSRIHHALMAMVAIITIGFVTFLLADDYYNQQQTNIVAKEIALNHQNQFEMDYVASDVLDLDLAMSQLDFDLIHPIDLAEHVVVGARYCTIDSSIAAQLRIESPTNESAYTLYQFRSPTSLQLEEKVTIEVENVTVTLWHEDELVMGLASFTNGNE